MSVIAKLAGRLPGAKRLYRKLSSLARRQSEPYPRGHFYSPLPSLSEVSAKSDSIFRPDVKLDAGINLRDEEQVALLRKLAEFTRHMSFPIEATPSRRYHAGNSFFGLGSAYLTAAMILDLRPKRIIEIGSGFSSAMMLDVNDRWLAGTVEHTFVEPYPQRLLELMQPRDLDRHRLLQQPVQEVPLSLFQELQPNDVLFVDSSHVAKVGSDVNHLLFNVLPALNAGVVVHFHDIYWPFEYPMSWIVDSKRAWNECYFLRAFLQFNEAFEIVLYPQYLRHKHADLMRDLWPAWWQDPGSALWVRKRK
jgi:predicted O-methyltransferase YrrM